MKGRVLAIGMAIGMALVLLALPMATLSQSTVPIFADDKCSTLRCADCLLDPSCGYCKGTISNRPFGLCRSSKTIDRYCAFYNGSIALECPKPPSEDTSLPPADNKSLCGSFNTCRQCFSTPQCGMCTSQISGKSVCLDSRTGPNECSRAGKWIPTANCAGLESYRAVHDGGLKIESMNSLIQDMHKTMALKFEIWVDLITDVDKCLGGPMISDIPPDPCYFSKIDPPDPDLQARFAIYLNIWRAGEMPTDQFPPEFPTDQLPSEKDMSQLNELVRNALAQSLQIDPKTIALSWGWEKSKKRPIFMMRYWNEVLISDYQAKLYQGTYQDRLGTNNGLGLTTGALVWLALVLSFIY